VKHGKETFGIIVVKYSMLKKLT